ncbi:cysteine--tRNA ligase [Limisphaera sp. VF-2]|jgi:cysteinyl-tRNA synthetase|uniref:cysteine--tRNA ligase n=1 Tax=Limisphaera sp. VF-2 TaxID=3400418 RepID=UPI0017692999
MKLFNTLTRTLEEFVPLDPGGRHVGMYCCGPTVYDYAHIGNWRTFVFADLLRRYLEFRGYGVRHVMNITDVEDKIIRRVRETGMSLREYTARYEAAFFEDFETLRCRRPHLTPRATEHIPDIIALIERLMARGLAYRAADGSVYFSIEKYRAAGGHYGQLVRVQFDQLRPGERVRSDEYAKETPVDFALWKARTPEDGEIFWPSPWGEGRPGWHIECSAMSMKALGPSFDLHLGGEDLMFPHHEDEIAQSEGAALQPPGQRFVKYWLHGAFLLVEGRKMSKSLGNFFTLRDLLARGFSGREIRYTLLTAHYRETFNFTLEGLQAARGALGRLDECLTRLREVAAAATGNGAPTAAQAVSVPDLVGPFTAAMDEDLNISAAWAAVFEWVRQLNRAMAAGELTPDQARVALDQWQRVDQVLGVGEVQELQVPPEIQSLVEARQAARKARDFARADALREQLRAAGWLVEDTPKGPRLKRIQS